MSWFPRRLLACASLAVLLMAGPLRAAGPRGVVRTMDFSYETRDPSVGGAVERYQFQTKWDWELARRSRLGVVVPYQWVSYQSPGTGQSYSKDALKDITLDWRLQVRETKDSRPSGYWHVSVNAPTGAEKLTASEALAIDAINLSGEGFVVPEFGRGLGTSVGYGLTLHQGARSSLAVEAGYAYRASFSPSDGVTRDDADDAYVNVSLKREVTPRRTVSAGFGAFYFFDERLTEPSAGVDQTVERDPDYVLSFGMTSRINPGLRTDLYFAYNLRGTLDYVNASGATFIPGVEQGDRLQLEYQWHRKMSPVLWLDYGAAYLKTFGSTDASGGAVFDNARDDVGAVVGVTRELNAGLSFRAKVQAGLTDESRDLVATTALAWDF